MKAPDRSTFTSSSSAAIVAATLLALTAAASVVGCGSAGSSQEACERYLGCIAEIRPGELDGLLRTYGAEGSCWSSSEVAVGCGAFCRGELQTLAYENIEIRIESQGLVYAPFHRSCVECTSDRHCVDDKNPACLAPTGLCVPCTEDADCQGSATSEDPFHLALGGPDDRPRSVSSLPRRYCGFDIATRVEDTTIRQAVAACVECRVDDHCTDPRLPHCLEVEGICAEGHDCPTDRPYRSGRQCVECMRQEDCGDSAASCVDGTCQRSCQDVMRCLRQACDRGCSDPNMLCDLPLCKTAIDYAQCVANDCTDCFRTGFDAYQPDFNCESCISLNCAHHEKLCSDSGC